MSNVIDQLASLRAGSAQPVSDDIIRRDLLRGRAALLRRRARRVVTGLGMTAAVAATAVAVTSGQTPSESTDLDLVAYTGSQLPGFTVGKVPEGFVLQGADSWSLDIARPEDNSGLGDFRGKLVVMLQSVDVTDAPEGRSVVVDGRPATISKVDPAATQLYYTDGTRKVVVQSATELGLTDDELVEFAESVTVTAHAQAGRG